MYERSYGDKYNHGGWESAADIAKKMRADIKAAIASGELPGKAANYSVRSRSYSGGQAIDIEARDLPGMWQQCEGIIPGSEDGHFARSCGNVWCKAGGQYRDHPSAQYHDILSAEGRRIEKVLQKIHDSYNHFGSEVMVDYFDQRYWGHAEIESKWAYEARQREKERKAKKLASAS
jgi:antirestriction protein